MSQEWCSRTNDLLAELIELQAAEAVIRGHFQMRERQPVEIPVGLRNICVEGNGGRCRQPASFSRERPPDSPGETIAKKNTAGIDQRERGAHKVREIDEAFVNALVQAVPLAAEDAVQVDAVSCR